MIMAHDINAVKLGLHLTWTTVNQAVVESVESGLSSAGTADELPVPSMYTVTICTSNTRTKCQLIDYRLHTRV